jgi:type VI secretion system secreted protein VgrG
MRKYAADGTTEITLTVTRSFKIYAPVKTGTEISVEVRFSVEMDGVELTDEDVARAKTNLETAASTWNNKFTLVANDPQCPSKTLKIVFKPVWVDSGQHYTFKVHTTYARPGLTGPVMDVSGSTTAWQYAHEFGHCFGLPDEYSYSPTDAQQVKYIKPDGTLDAAISAPPGGKSRTAADATIMSAIGNTTRLPRHAWAVAIEVQELLKQKLGRDVKCSILFTPAYIKSNVGNDWGP